MPTREAERAAMCTLAVAAALLAVPTAEDDGLQRVLLAAGCGLLGFLAVWPRQRAVAAPKAAAAAPNATQPTIAAASPPSPTTPPSKEDEVAAAASAAAPAAPTIVPTTPAVEQLRSLIAPSEVTACVAHRFINANKGDVKRAARMYGEYLRWYEREDVASVLDEPGLEPALDAVLREGYDPRLLSGLDRKQRPVIISDFGSIDLRAMRKRGVTLAMITRRHVRELEKLHRLLECAADPLAGHLSVLDVGRMDVYRFINGWKLWMAFAKTAQSYYPELLGKCILVNAPSSAAWAVDQFKKFVDPVTASKIEVICGRDNCAAAIDAHLPPETVALLPPSMAGGARRPAAAPSAEAESSAPPRNSTTSTSAAEVRPSSDGGRSNKPAADIPPGGNTAPASPQAASRPSTPAASPDDEDWLTGDGSRLYRTPRSAKARRELRALSSDLAACEWI